MADEGGGIKTTGGTVIVNESTISDNEAEYGGGISNHLHGYMTISNSTISGNKAENGGGIYDEGDMDITESLFKANKANQGDGIYDRYGLVTLDDKTIFRGDEYYCESNCD